MDKGEWSKKRRRGERERRWSEKQKEQSAKDTDDALGEDYCISVAALKGKTEAQVQEIIKGEVDKMTLSRRKQKAIVKESKKTGLDPVDDKWLLQRVTPPMPLLRYGHGIKSKF